MQKQHFFAQEDLGGVNEAEFLKSLEEANNKAESTTIPKYNERMPYVGEIVLFTPNSDDTVARSNSNEGPIAAIVTRVWSSITVNLKIIPDHGPMQDRSSVVHITANPAGYHFEFLQEKVDLRDVVFK